MQKYPIPLTDLHVSPLALGTMQLGGAWDKDPLTDLAVETTAAIIETALGLGINHLDLADIYTFGKSDQAIGRVLAAQPGLRQQLVIQQKCGIVLPQEPGHIQHYNLSAGHIVTVVEQTLTTLGTDYLDILALHRPDPLAAPEEVATAFDQLHQTGKVRWFGVSNHSAGQLALLKRWVDQPIVLNQLELSLFRHQLISDGLLINTSSPQHSQGLLDYCRMHDIFIQAWSPLAQGRMFDTASPLGRVVAATADELGAPAEAVALAWILRHPAKIQPIVGTGDPERLASCAKAVATALSRQQWYRLLEASRGQPAP
ncbi:MAG: aldo/keto reductase [Pseudomonadota bacterium]